MPPSLPIADAISSEPFATAGDQRDGGAVGGEPACGCCPDPAPESVTSATVFSSGPAITVKGSWPIVIGTERRRRPVARICYDGSDDAQRAIAAAPGLLGPRHAVVLDVGPPRTLVPPAKSAH